MRRMGRDRRGSQLAGSVFQRLAEDHNFAQEAPMPRGDRMISVRRYGRGELETTIFRTADGNRRHRSRRDYSSSATYINRPQVQNLTLPDLSSRYSWVVSET
jgi:hypothetical protein